MAEPSASAGIPYITYGANSGAVSTYGGFPGLGGGGTPTESNGAGSATDFGGLSGAGSPPQQ